MHAMHQPTRRRAVLCCATRLQQFDELLLLKRGGETIFSGSLGKDACNLTSYFQALPGVEPMALGWVLGLASKLKP